MQINGQRWVTNVRCTCVGNQSKRCKHVAALIFFINNCESLSKTDFEQEWGRPSAHALAKEKYAKGSYFHQMFPPKRRFNEVEPTKVTLDELLFPCPLKIVMQEESKDKVHHSITNFFKAARRAQEQRQKNNGLSKLVGFIISREWHFDIYTKMPAISKELCDFYNQRIVLDKDKIIQLSVDTVSQSNNKTWFEERELRISASSNVHHIKSRSTKTVEKLVGEILYSKPINVKATKYGLAAEKDASRLYEQQYKVKLIEVGLIVSPRQPWLCCSLDAVAVVDGDGDDVEYDLIEIKSPLSCKDKEIVNFSQKKCNVTYLEIINDVVQLKKHTMYYSQCQTLMYVANKDRIYLYVYTPVINGSIRVTIRRDEQFLKNAILKSEDFFFRDYLPALIAKKDKENAKNVAKDKDNLNKQDRISGARLL